MTIVRDDEERVKHLRGEESSLDMSSPENRGQRVSNFLKRVQQLVRKTRRAKGKTGMRGVEEIVREDQLPEFRIDFDFNFDFLEPVRSLEPKMALKAPDRHWNPKCDIMCQVVRAVNVPVRAMGGTTTGRKSIDGDDGGAANWLEDRVRPFVEIKFQSTRVETTCQDGPSPIFNDTRTLAVHLPGENEFTPRTLLALEDRIVFSLMDDVPIDGRDPRTKVSRARADDDSGASDDGSYGSRFLGSFSVPFSVLYKSGGRISGWFEVETPAVLLGYETKQDLRVSNDGGDAENTSKRGDDAESDDDDLDSPRRRSPTRSSAFRTMVEVLLTLQPSMAVPTGIFCAPEVDRSAPRKVKLARRRAVRWHKRLSSIKRMHGRVFNPLVPNMKATETLITRYVLPQRPPPMPRISGSDGTDSPASDVMKSLREIAAFVALVPFCHDWHIDAKKEDMWCTSEELFKLLAGDWEEHAILLCNYMLWLEQERGGDGGRSAVYVALGQAVPQGSCCFVVRIAKPGGRVEIWDPTTARRFDSKDRDAPLKTISSLLGRSDASDEKTTNFWANVQTETAPWLISYDVSNANAWTPLRSPRKVTKRRLPSVQINPLPYKPTDVSYVVDTDALLEREIRKALRHWRSRELHLTTDFNHTACRALKPLLKKLEEARVGLVEVVPADHEHAMRRMSSTYDVFGFPLHMTFTDLRDVIRRVRQTGVHRNVVRGTQFAVTTFVQGYTNTICSVWIYLAVLIPK